MFAEILVNLVGKISWGDSVRRVLVREAKLCSSSAVVIGISKCNALRGSLCLARYCAKRLSPTTSVLVIDNGKVVFDTDNTKQSTGLKGDPRPSFHSIHPIAENGSKILIPCEEQNPNSKFSNVSDVENVTKIAFDSKVGSTDSNELELGQDSPLTEKVSITKSDETDTGSSSSTAFPSTFEIASVGEIKGGQFHLAQEQIDEVPPCSISLMRNSAESKPGWPLLRRLVTSNSKNLRHTQARKMSVVQWVMKLPNRSVSLDIRSQQCLEPNRREIRESDEKCIMSSLSAWFALPKELETLLTTNATKCRIFNRRELENSMIRFSPENLIGKGGCSRVYKGYLANDQPVAVKILKSSKEAWNAFLLEVDILTSLQHKHIIPLIGVCVDDNDLISVYKFLSRGTLDENLHGKGENSMLPWEVRFKVAVEVAEALSYLHSECPRPVIHRDVKSSNILLSDRFEAQLSDFGLALRAPTTSPFITYSHVVGTFGYIAPEYFMYGKISDKIDVYSYGVVLLELLSGRKPIDVDNPKGQESLVMWAIPKLESGSTSDLLDPNLAGEFDENQMRRMVLASTLCITRTGQQRPQMSQILKLLQGDEDVVEWAKAEVNVPKESDNQDEVYPTPSIRSSNLDLSLLEADDDTTSTSSSIDQTKHHSLEDCFRG